MNRPIRKIGDPVLRRKAKKVEKITKETQRLIDDMVETMRAADGIGLAAPQVGVSQRIAVVEIEADENVPGSGKLYVLINPEIVARSEEEQVGVEGCLSIPGWQGEVARPARITVRALDRNGQRYRLEAEGLLARVILHEIDHLDGILFLDRLTAPDRIWRVEPKPARSAA
ncbi:MAG: peptide deformylase [Thermoflexales bacterium]|nr:peptide deformylase [Thermoflexales bacterium]MCS7324882.1 peptide deformylase [Thermoflexales bacterium]MCX7938836.1 peptide deformylase [Thermoflexales bacterium]MDW8053696.1 peptide deformylase [Anaerolineae bacterium]MDW8293403.1 peptide deformylase [Anaerolineae bacterium]